VYHDRVLIPISPGVPKMVVRLTTHWAAQLLENPDVGSGLGTKLSDPDDAERRSDP
jgi:hypothetical protein